jgi:hypothetical protein
MKEIMDMTIDDNRIVAEWKETKYIVLSSSLFMIPAIYGYYHNLYFLPFALFIASLISMNYWRHATYSYRRIVDRSCSKIAFMICFYHSTKYASLNLNLFLQYIGFFTFVYYYYMSNKYHNAPGWWKYHIKFHVFCVYTQLMIIQNIGRHNIAHHNIAHHNSIENI